METVQRLTVLPGEAIATINPYLHGHFAEHLGELVYPGICVGPQSKIPNIDGLRCDVIAALKPLGIPVLRWPGGCFADMYHWRDGIGPRERRPMRINVHWGMVEEPNTFGTHEFVAFCRALGAEPYFAGNLGSGTPAELAAWVEYCNFAGRSTLADERRANGSPEPLGIRFWGIGNENWGCGGSMSPEAYAEDFCRYRTYVYNYPGMKAHAIACGPNGGDWDWTRRFFKHVTKNYWDRRHHVQSFAAHYYCGTAGTATVYTPEQWLELLAKASVVEGVIAGHRAIMDEYDPERRINLILDEWGAWHPVEEGKPQSGFYQQSSIRDALVAALSLDTFHRQADKLFMANIAQLINVLQALLLVEEDKCILTPTYHVFNLYRPHKGATAVRVESASETISDGGPSRDACRQAYLTRAWPSLRAVSGSASVKEGVLCVTATNSHPAQPVELEIELVAGHLDEVEVVHLSADDIRAHNTFARPDRVRLAPPRRAKARSQQLRVTMPAASVVRVMGKLM